MCPPALQSTWLILFLSLTLLGYSPLGFVFAQDPGQNNSAPALLCPSGCPAGTQCTGGSFHITTNPTCVTCELFGMFCPVNLSNPGQEYRAVACPDGHFCINQTGPPAVCPEGYFVLVALSGRVGAPLSDITVLLGPPPSSPRCVRAATTAPNLTGKYNALRPISAERDRTFRSSARCWLPVPLALEHQILPPPDFQLWWSCCFWLQA